MNNNTPYENLNPDTILNAIESIGFQCNGSLLSLNSYENRVYQVGLEKGAPIIAKFYRPSRWSDDTILEEHQFAQELVEHEIPVVAPLASNDKKTLHHYEGYRFALFPRWGGRALELDNIDQLEWMGRFIGRLHAVGSCRPFLHRPTLDINTYGVQSFHYLINHNFIPGHLKDKYCVAAETVLTIVTKRFQATGDIKHIRLHGDMHAGNVLWNDQGPHIVDLDDCVMGPAMQDIWMLLSGNTQQMRLQLEYILDGYSDFYDFNYREINLLEALRTLRQLNYSAWLASRWQDPAFPKHFPWFNTEHYWAEQIHNLNEQIILLEESN